MRHGILSTIGSTPLIELKQLFADAPFDLFAKMESFNPGGSMKDRAALRMIEDALSAGLINQNTTIIESSSGNMGIGLAQACAYLKMPFICVVDIKTTSQNIKILETYGAKVDIVTKPDPVTGELLQARLNRVKQLLSETPNSWWADQYANYSHARAHLMTMDEIVESCGRAPDYLFLASGTCGTLRGCADYIKSHELSTHIYAIDALGSVIFGPNVNCKRLIPGHGAARRPELFNDGLADNVTWVSDLDCVIGCHRLLRREAILAGGSTGAVVMGIDRVKDQIPAGSLCVMIVADRGERYLDTIYNEEWVASHFGDISEQLNDAPTVVVKEPVHDLPRPVYAAAPAANVRREPAGLTA